MTTLPFNGSIGLGHTVTLRTREGVAKYRFQNYFFGESVIFAGQPYIFVPFGFSGLSTSKQRP